MSAESKAKVLIVDDDKKLCRLLSDYLEAMNYEIALAHTGPDGLEAAKAGGHAAVILDVMLPGMDGFEVLKQLRTSSQVPVIMLTARGDETDRIVGLEMGADDYLPKPFSTRELLARLRAIQRRYDVAARPAQPDVEGQVTVGELSLDPGGRNALLGGERLDLTSLEFDLLHCLARGAGRVLSRDQILDAVAGREHDVFDRSIDVHISALRKKLGDDPKQPRFIKTIRGSGYMYVRPAD
jgi:two-component system, OmpR family, response regulator CpxR